jgi:CRP/FNR family transcriptional regulator, anaerobic regulatory protein
MCPSKENIPSLVKSLEEKACLTGDEIEFYLSLLRIKKIRKKEHILSAGDVSTSVAYVNKGCLRRYIIDNHSKEIIINFSLEDYWTGDLESLLMQKPTIYFVQALEDCELLLLSRENLLRAENELPKFREFHENLVHRNHYVSLRRLSIANSATPEEKYILAMKEQPQLFQRVPLHYIASYLGIEPESLSRLRKRIFIKPPNT